MTLVCTCRRVVSRGDDDYREYRVVKSRRWDCPSCGLDRKRTLATMCAVANAGRIVTLTLEQPRVLFDGSTNPGELPAGARSTMTDEGLLVPVWQGLREQPGTRPDRHAACDRTTHVAWNPRHGGYRWRVVPECPHCLRNLSRMLAAWVKRMRRQHPGFAYLHAREIHKSGAVHLHVAVTGLSRVVTRRSRAGEHVKRAWREVGGGFVDVGKHGDNAGRDAGWYVGKYLAKQQENRFARGFRRWSRAQSFAPGVRMSAPPRDPDDDGGWADPGAPLRLGGWVHPDGTEHTWRWSQTAAERCEAARLDTSTANSPLRGGWAWSGPLVAAPDGLLWGRNAR